MNEKLALLKSRLTELSANPEFVHHDWFAKYHLEIVAQIANELLDHYPNANREIVEVMAWMHDYGKILDFDNQYDVTLTAGPDLLREVGYGDEIIQTVIRNIEILDKKLEISITEAPIEVQIVSSADGCSHFVGPFLSVWWAEHPDKNVEELLADDIRKIEKDWNYKVVLPEARAAFQTRHDMALERAGKFPERYITN